MPVTLEWLLAQPELHLRRVVGDDVAGPVTCAHPIEVADPTPLLTGGELVLTTGQRLAGSRADQRVYVDSPWPAWPVSASASACATSGPHAASSPRPRVAEREGKSWS